MQNQYWTRQDALSEMKSEIFNYWSDVVGGKIVCTQKLQISDKVILLAEGKPGRTFNIAQG